MNKHLVQKNMKLVHKDLVALLDKAVDGFGISDKACQELFAFFSKKLEAHFNFEESQIFGLTISNPEAKKIIKQLYAEHNQMRLLLHNIQVDKMNNKHIDLSEFVSLINRHHQMEDRYLYRWIDEEMDEQSQKVIVEKI